MEDYCREKINKVTTENLLTVSTPYKINRGMERWYCCRWLLLDILAVSSFCLGPGQILLWFDALRISIGLCVSAGVLKVIGAQPRRVMCNHTRCRSRERWTAGNYAKCRPLARWLTAPCKQAMSAYVGFTCTAASRVMDSVLFTHC